MDEYLRHRDELVGLAYRITGSMSDAEDIVQATWFSWSRHRDDVHSPRAWLRRATTNAAIDHVRRRKHAPYRGPWLPEPSTMDEESAGWLTASGSEESRLIAVQTGDIVLLHMMESLSPRQRAAFVLRRAMGLDYGELSEILGRTEAACRQLVSRAARSLESAGAFDREAPDVETSRFAGLVTAVLSGDREALMEVLAVDSVAISDGGGNVPPRFGPSTARPTSPRTCSAWRKNTAPHSTRARCPSPDAPGLRSAKKEYSRRSSASGA